MLMIPETRERAPQRWKRRKPARADEILAAAAELLTENGGDAIRMSDIAARAGITKGTIYLYFANKAEIMRVLAERQPAAAPQAGPSPLHTLIQAAE